VRPGDGVALYMANCPEFLVAFWAPGSPGRRSWPSTTSFTRQEAASILGNSGAARVFVTPDLAPGLRAVTDVPIPDVTSAAFAAMTRGPGAAVAHREEGDLAWLFHTSGTTGRPKA
jgi:long-chain acyl-CoA synthetase